MIKSTQARCMNKYSADMRGLMENRDMLLGQNRVTYLLGALLPSSGIKSTYSTTQYNTFMSYQPQC